MLDIDTLVESINNLKKKNKEFVTNAFFSTKQLEQKIESKNCEIIIDEDVIAILEKNELFCSLYFYAHSMRDLIKLKKMIDNSNSLIVVDLVGKVDSIEKISQYMCDYGFELYAKYSRWQTNAVKKILFESINNVNIEAANISDTLEIFDMFSKQFDAITSHLPSLEKTKTAINSGEVYIIKESANIAGFIWFENMGAKLKYLYLIVIKDEYKSMGYGVYLYEKIFNLFEENTAYNTWTNDTFKAVNNILKHFGFKKDGLVDYILRYNINEGG